MLNARPQKNSSISSLIKHEERAERVFYVINIFNYGCYMPVKRGPNGTLRRYSSSTGRYVKDDTFLPTTDKSLLKYQREKMHWILKQEEQLNRAKKMKDPLLEDVVEIIHNYFPKSIEAINEHRFMPNYGAHYELDIVTNKFIIEVKSGNGRRKLTQYLRQKEFAEERHKKAIVYAPDMNKKTQKVYESKGVKIVNTLIDLIKEMKQ